MKNIAKLFIPLICVCLLLSGCAVWMGGSYVSVSPNQSWGGVNADGKIQISSYEQMQTALIQMVEEGASESIVYITGMSEDQIYDSMDKAIGFVSESNPIGAYAVKEIAYEIGTNMGRTAVALKITYNHNRPKILEIKKAKNMDDVLALIRLALDNCEAGTVLRVNDYQKLDIVQYVQDYVNDNPQKCMEMPQVSAANFPENSSECVIEVTFTYQTNRDSLRAMQQSVQDVFKSAQLYINYGTESEEKYAQLYTFLMERYAYTIETSITPSYSLLRHGVGDSKAFATVYAAMCRQVDLDCNVISGTKSGEAYHWNVIRDGETCYYIDLLACHKAGTFTFKTAEEMTGYVWDYSAY